MGVPDAERSTSSHAQTLFRCAILKHRNTTTKEHDMITLQLSPSAVTELMSLLGGFKVALEYDLKQPDEQIGPKAKRLLDEKKSDCEAMIRIIADQRNAQIED